jgi:hypothetical protein
LWLLCPLELLWCCLDWLLLSGDLGLLHLLCRQLLSLLRLVSTLLWRLECLLCR